MELPHQPLLSAPERRMWRVRQRSEMEEATLEGSRSPAQKVRLCSLDGGREQISLVFHNASSRSARCIWLDFSGNEVPYTILQPGELRSYHTFVGHPWIIRDTESERRMCVNGAQAVVGGTNGAAVVITEPPPLPWREDTHMAFPEPVKQQVLTTLLCYNRLSRGSSAAGEAEAMDVEGSSSSSGRDSLVPAGPPCGSSKSESMSSSPMQPEPACTLGDLPPELVMLICSQLAAGLPAIWQDAGVRGGHPDILPCAWPNARLFKKLRKLTQEQCSEPQAVAGLRGSPCSLQ